VYSARHFPDNATLAEGANISSDSALLNDALAHTGDVFANDTVRLGILRHGVVDFAGAPAQLSKQVWRLLGEATTTLRTAEAQLEAGGEAVVVPLIVGDTAAGVLVLERPQGIFAAGDRRLMGLLASQLAVSIENTRLYRQLNGLFSQFMPADVAAALVADPEQAALGGTVRDVTVLFADLRGFTALSERIPPGDVMAMLNHYFGVAVPLVINHGGTVTTFIGDALMAMFNAPTMQEDHALRACKAALAVQRDIEAIATGPESPRFKIGVNTGPALVGNMGSSQRRTYTAIGDTVNLAARLESGAEAGQTVIGSGTYEAIKPVAVAESLGHIRVKGKAEPVEAFQLLGLMEAAPTGATVTISVPRRTK
jgi:class 3 adenylate cyclase